MKCPTHDTDLHSQQTRYGARHYCPVDGCTVACWDGSTSTPADERTRMARRACHERFDRLWRKRRGERRMFFKQADAYRWLAEKMNLPACDAHIGMFDFVQCETLLAILDGLTAGARA